jgi:spermidine synthase
MPNPITRQVPLGILLLLFVLSGAAGLIYEVVWARQLVLVFGNTSQAVSTILTGFFGGLALGGWFGGRVADRVARPLRLYGLLEMVVVAVVLLTPVTFRLIGEVYRGIYPALAEVPLALALVRFVLAIVALAPATLLMGATLPTLTRFLTQGRGSFAGAFQRLYAANTVGAIAGTAIAGFVLIELFGLTGALITGAICSGSAGLIAFLLDRRVAAVPSPEAAAPARSTDRISESWDMTRYPLDRVRDRRRLALALAFISGLTSLGYQVTWNRLLSAGTGSSTYVFTIILALFLIGIAVGAVLLGYLRHRTEPRRLIALAQIVTAAFVVIGAATLASPPIQFNGGSATAFVDSLRAFISSAAIIVLPPTIAMGVVFPATASLMGDERGNEGEATGSLLALNTLGSLVATFVLPFFVIPLIGSPATLATLALVNCAIGGLLIVTTRHEPATSRAVGSLIAVVVAVSVIGSSAAGIAFYNPTITLITQSGGETYDATEDEVAPVEAGEIYGFGQLWVSGTSMTFITVDTKFMPLLPKMLRADAETGLVIAFGMGTSFRTSLNAGMQTDVVELVPSVPRMFKWFYDDADAVLADPNGDVIVADGRNHVELTDRRYDYVVVDPPPPIESSGVSVISTLEFYQAAKGVLHPEGVMLQWIPYGQTLNEFLAHVRSLLAVFQNVNVIAGPGGYGFNMIASDGPVDVAPERIREVLELPGVLDDVNSAPDSQNRTIDQWIATFEGLQWASGDVLRGAVGDGPLITDDRPLPEYFIIRRLTNPNATQLSLPALRELTGG